MKVHHHLLITIILVTIIGTVIYFLYRKYANNPSQKSICGPCIKCMDTTYDNDVINCLNDTCMAKCQTDPTDPQKCYNECIPQTYVSCAKSKLPTNCSCNDCIDCINQYYGDQSTQKSKCGMSIQLK